MAELHSILKPSSLSIVKQRDQDTLTEYRPRSATSSFSQNARRQAVLRNTRYDIYGRPYLASHTKQVIVKPRNVLISQYGEQDVMRQTVQSHFGGKARSYTQQAESYYDADIQNTAKKAPYGAQNSAYDVMATAKKDFLSRSKRQSALEISQVEGAQQRRPGSRQVDSRNGQYRSNSRPQTSMPYNRNNSANAREGNNRQSAPDAAEKAALARLNRAQQQALAAQTEVMRTAPNDTNFDESHIGIDTVDDRVSDNGQDQCFEIDYSFLETISIEDPRLQKLLSPELLKQKKIDLTKILEENGDYFHHLFKNCACYKCTCGNCRCPHSQSTTFKRTFKNGLRSSYNGWFSQASSSNLATNDDPLNQSHYETLTQVWRSNPKFDPKHPTEHREEYKKHPLPKKHRRVHTRLPEQPIQKLTSYGINFKDWKDQDPRWIFKAPQHKSTVGNDHAMDTKTIYEETIGKSTRRDRGISVDANDVKEKQYQNPMPEYWRDDKPTQYKTAHKFFDPRNVPNTKLPFKYFTQTQKAETIPSFEKQFMSTFHNDFRKSPKRFCPSRATGMSKPWRTKTLRSFQTAQSTIERTVSERRYK